MPKLMETEVAYVQCYSETHTTGRFIEFWDDNITDMYSHNYSLVTGPITSDELVKLITELIELYKSKGKTFLQVEIDFPLEEEVAKALPLNPDVTVMDFMLIRSDKYDALVGNEDCSIVVARSEEVLSDGIKVDILANTPGMGADFAQRRIARKVAGYRVANCLDLYVCYHRGEPIGHCELFVNGDVAKVEDFEILEAYQKKGFGTSVLKHLMWQAKEQGAEWAYLITDNADTAKEMYLKCGFEFAGRKTQLHFTL